VAHRKTVLRPELAGTHFFFSYDQQTGFRLPLVSALLGLALHATQIRDSRGYTPIDFMPEAKALDTYYKTLTDQELLKLAAGGGFTAEAEQALGKELARRNLTPDEASRYGAPQWLDKADVGAVGILVLESGERISAEVVEGDGNPDRGRDTYCYAPPHKTGRAAFPHPASTSGVSRLSRKCTARRM
jgi:hypothetical protein